MARSNKAPSRYGDDSEHAGSGESAQSSFRFTFSCSSTGSSKGSVIEPDPEFQVPQDCDSSESLTDSVQNYPEEFGRTYHAYRAGSYVYPNDLPEQERMNLQGEALRRLYGGRLFFSPLSKTSPPRQILDIATGTGEWAIQVGDYFPQSQVVATDLSPIQPEDVPPNVNFYVEDSSEPWDYSNPFDFIHTRVTAGCWSSFKTQVAEQAFLNLAPGGWLESHEYDADVQCDDNTLDYDGPLLRWVRDIVAAAEELDRPVIVARYLKQIFEEVGFVDVHEKVYKMPTNAWARDERLKDLGRMWERNMATGLSGFSLSAFHRVFNRTAEETEVSLVNVRRQLSDPRVHAYFPVYAVWGRKPFPGEATSSSSTTPQQ